MAFGEGFKHMDNFEKLEVGHYKAKIIKAELKNGSYSDYIQGEVEIEGHPKANPHIFLLNDSPKQGYGSLTLEKAMEIWCGNMTAFFNSFNIPEGDFEPSHWIGKSGDVTVRVQKKNPQYNELVMYKTSFETKAKKEEPKTEEFKEDPLPDIF